MLIGHVGLFTGIRLEIVEVVPTVFEAFNQLLVAGSYCAARKTALVTVVRIVPIQRLAIERLSARQKVFQTLPVGLASVPIHADEIQDRGIKVDAHHRHVTGGVGFCHARCTNQERFTDPAFVEPAFSTSQRQVTRW